MRKFKPKQAARREDPNRVVFKVSRQVDTGELTVHNMTGGKKYVLSAYGSDPQEMAETLEASASASLRFQSMGTLDGPELNYVQAPRLPRPMAERLVTLATAIVGAHYVALQGTSTGLQWVILPRAPKFASEARSVQAAMADGSVESFLLVLSGLLTQQDMRDSAREKKRPGGQENIYRLGHYMRALSNVRSAMKGRESSSDPKDLEALKAAAAKAFSPEFPPLKALVKAVDSFLATGKAPSYPVSRKA